MSASVWSTASHPKCGSYFLRNSAFFYCWGRCLYISHAILSNAAEPIMCLPLKVATDIWWIMDCHPWLEGHLGSPLHLASLILWYDTEQSLFWHDLRWNASYTFKKKFFFFLHIWTIIRSMLCHMINKIWC